MLNNDHDIKRTYGEDLVVWITVGLDASVDDLYDRMGKCSVLESDNLQRMKSFHNKEDQRTVLIEVFSKKRIVLILDDVWEKQYDSHDMMYWLDVAKAPGSATLITTRSKPVLQIIGAEVEVVLSLDDDDSWKLFSSHAFVNEASTSIAIPEQLARAICKECKGLPLALKVIGCAMAVKESKDEWECALKDLQQSTPFLESNVDVQLFSRLQLSYNELKSDATRICFLYFVAFPEDHKIGVEGLINIWVGEDLFGPNFSIEEAKRKAYEHLRVLAKRALIYWKEGEEVAFIHDILRDLALHIINNAEFGECAYECLFYSDRTSIAFPPRTRVVKVKRMSFMNCSISQWPEALQIACSKVRVFIFQSTTIMEGGGSLDLLKNMHDLRVLDLSRNSYISRTHLLSIRNLAHITTLNLSHCGSISKLPRSICNLKCLLELDLSSCASLVGLPESIGNLKCLTELDLSFCRSLVGLPKSIGNLEVLTKLKLTKCFSLTSLLESIGNLKCLMKLDMSWCRSLVGLPESIGNLKYLTKLDMSECKSLVGLLESIGNLKCLTQLHLRNCKSLVGLPESIGNLKCLTKLNISCCNSLVGLLESIGNFKCLLELGLSSCASLVGLPENIGNLKCLMKLNMSWCSSLVGLPESIGNLKCLTKLDLSYCSSLMGLPESIGNLKCLLELDLLLCKSLVGLPMSIGNLKCLTELDVSYCSSLASLPESIGNLECLTELKLGDCPSLTSLPESIGNLKCLTQLHLRNCKSLVGLPESIGNLKCLMKLDMS